MFGEGKSLGPIQLLYVGRRDAVGVVSGIDGRKHTVVSERVELFRRTEGVNGSMEEEPPDEDSRDRNGESAGLIVESRPALLSRCEEPVLFGEDDRGESDGESSFVPSPPNVNDSVSSDWRLPAAAE